MHLVGDLFELENVIMKIHLHGLQVFKKASKKIFLYKNKKKKNHYEDLITEMHVISNRNHFVISQ